MRYGKECPLSPFDSGALGSLGTWRLSRAAFPCYLHPIAKGSSDILAQAAKDTGVADRGHDSCEVEIDMDQVAEAVARQGDRPAFYVAEQSQQRKFNCTACGEFNDIRGRFGYCSVCGTRNDLDEFLIQVRSIRDRLNTEEAPPEDCLRDAASAFGSFATQVAKQLFERVPMTPRRQGLLAGMGFYNIRAAASNLCSWRHRHPCAYSGSRMEACGREVSSPARL